MKITLLTIAGVGLILYASLALIGSTLVPPVYTVHSDIELPASPERSWDVLTDLSQYPAWNPYLIRTEGKLEAGQSLSITLVDANFKEPLTVKPRVRAVEPHRQFYWTGSLGISGIADTRHYFVLHPTERGTTRFEQFEEFRGLVSWLLPKREERIAKTRAAFELMNKALQQRLASML